jgi:phage repressor protein C with HTH and peptisase S24 domain
MFLICSNLQLVEEISSAMVAIMTPADPRDALVSLARDAGQGLSALSAMLGRNQAYLGQYVRRGTPRLLPERERRLLADHFGVPEAVLGAPPAGAEAFVRVPRLAIAASAGAGASVDAELELAAALIPAALARRLRLERGSVIRVRGDSMEPGLRDGDLLLVDTARRAPDARGGVYVIRLDDALMVKRVRRGEGGLRASSDNPLAPPLPVGPIEVIGQVVWQMREPR